MKKGQAAIEYLTTYGWTILVILITVGTLIYFNAFNPMQFVPESCDFGDQIICDDYFIDELGNIKFIFLNSFSKDIRIYGATSNTFNITACTVIDINSGDLGTFECNMDPILLPGGPGEKILYDMLINFSRKPDGDSPPFHYIRGTTVTQVEEVS